MIRYQSERIAFLKNVTALFFLSLLCAAQPALADPSVQIAWRLLDYIAVDYREAVQDGVVVNSDEYAEMTEFSSSAGARIDKLAASAAKEGLKHDATRLQELIASKSSPDDVAKSARALAAALIKAYPIPTAPEEVPDLALGHALYAKHCASCHGAEGDGKGPASAGLDPPPIAFSDLERAQERSIFGLYQVIEQGLDGTSMPAFTALPASDRWALAFYVSTMAFPDNNSTEGHRVWDSESSFRESLDLEKLVGLTPAALGDQVGEAKADALMAYLRRNPKALTKQPSGSLSLAKARISAALSAYERGDKTTSADLALSAYLDGFEPMEPLLASRDRKLLARMESAMGALRSGIEGDLPVAEVKARAQVVDELFGEVETAIAPGSASSASASSFFGSFAILFREGLEALLIVVAMAAFLRKADRQELIPYVHGGWVSALFAGVLTWGAATWLITISGATREMTEGVGSVIAAFVLLWVGIWMHGKSSANAWQNYVRERLNKALTKRSAWFLFGLAFLVVYREVFETILFYAAIWSQGEASSVIAGAAAGSLTLTVIAWVMMRYSKTLPIGRFFSVSSSLLAILAVVLIGKGVSALQEAGYVPINSLAGFPRIEILGMYPTMQGAAAQMLMIGLLILGFVSNTRAAQNRASSDAKAPTSGNAA